MSEQNPEAMAAEAAQKSAEANVHYMAMKYYCDKEMPVFVDDDKGRQDTIEKAFVAGAEWQKSRAQPPSTSAVEAAKAHEKKVGGDCVNSRTCPGTKVGECLSFFCGCQIYEAHLAGYAALEERLAEAEGIMKRQQLSNQSCGFLFDEDIGAYFAKHPSPARGEGVE